MRCGPFGPSSITSALSTDSIWSPSNAGARESGARRENLAHAPAAQFVRRPPRNFSTEGLTSTARPSALKSISPSSRPLITWSRFSRSVLKISRTSRNCFPMPMIFVLTAPNSSPRHDRFEVKFARGNAVQLRGDAFDRRERRAAHNERQQSRKQHRAQRPISRRNQAPAKFRRESAPRKGRCEYRRTVRCPD